MLCYSLADKSVSSIEQWTHALSQTAEGWVYVCVWERDARESEWVSVCVCVCERERERERRGEGGRGARVTPRIGMGNCPGYV